MNGPDGLMGCDVGPPVVPIPGPAPALYPAPGSPHIAQYHSTQIANNILGTGTVRTCYRAAAAPAQKNDWNTTVDHKSHMCYLRDGKLAR